jgi:hypothetical protein
MGTLKMTLESCRNAPSNAHFTARFADLLHCSLTGRPLPEDAGSIREVLLQASDTSSNVDFQLLRGDDAAFSFTKSLMDGTYQGAERLPVRGPFRSFQYTPANPIDPTDPGWTVKIPGI